MCLSLWVQCRTGQCQAGCSVLGTLVGFSALLGGLRLEHRHGHTHTRVYMLTASTLGSPWWVGLFARDKCGRKLLKALWPLSSDSEAPSLPQNTQKEARAQEGLGNPGGMLH